MNAYQKNILRSANAGSALLSSSLEYVFEPDMSVEDELEYDGIPTMAQWMGRIASDQSYARKMRQFPQSFVGEYSFLSNMFYCTVIIGDMAFPSAENAFQAMKCRTRKEMEQFQFCTPQEAKRLGSQVQLRSNWDQLRIPVMRKVLEAKFEDDELAMKLLKTDDMALCENNYWGDTFWGKTWKNVTHYYVNGEEVSREAYFNAKYGKETVSLGEKTRKEYVGENHLGKLLCEVRDKIRKDGYFEEFLTQYAEQANVNVDWLAYGEDEE